MTKVQYSEVTSNEAGQRLDNYLIRFLKGVPKSHIYRIIRSGEVRINQKRAKPLTKLQQGDKVIEILRKSRPDIPYIELVHRLDKETSGCLVLAKKRRVLREIQAQLSERTVEKVYWLVMKNPWENKRQIEVDEPLLKNVLKSGERMVQISKSGKSAQTTFALRDEKYGGQQKGLAKNKLKPRLYLHARSIQFNLEDRKLFFEADVDRAFKSTLEQLRLRCGESREK